MCTYIDRFPEYKTLLLRCIKSCENPVQLLCAYDMIDRFTEVFRGVISHTALRQALADLYQAYEEKQSIIHV